MTNITKNELQILKNHISLKVHEQEKLVDALGQSRSLLVAFEEDYEPKGHNDDLGSDARHWIGEIEKLTGRWS